MLRTLSAAAIGLVFGAGIVISGMANPAKVLNFFDVLGNWDPSLLLVMGSALGVTLVGYRLVLRRSAPAFDSMFHLPTKRDLDLPLIGGSALFGVGWGIAGFCPGGAIPALGSGELGPAVFVAAMIGGILLANGLKMAFVRRQELA
ncbi:MAG: permease [Devosia sp.]|nr:permease [Devosia sp.]